MIKPVLDPSNTDIGYEDSLKRQRTCISDDGTCSSDKEPPKRKADQVLLDQTMYVALVFYGKSQVVFKSLKNIIVVMLCVTPLQNIMPISQYMLQQIMTLSL